MMENQNIPKPINELLGMTFFIPAYQRGYRWDERQVIDLLDDVFEFIQQKAEGKEFYCLQPIIIKNEKEYYKVIDGQQRLTTIYIILSYLNKRRFTLLFETRERSMEFLENLSAEINVENIDFYHISNAYRYIKKWFEAKELIEPTIREEFFIHLGKYTKFIWYEIAPSDTEIEVFTRINSGKIALTEAELIKGLFLNSKNFVEEEKSLRQIEIAKEWDEIEHTLQNNEFWYFLTTNRDFSTRINLIFEIFSDLDSTDELVVYKFFSRQKDIVRLWSDESESIKKIFLSLKYWFEERDLYHLIGFLISSERMEIREIYRLSKDRNKDEFRRTLYEEIKKGLDIEKLGELNYYNDKDEIFEVLLLFNIASIINHKNSYIRFAFDKFNREKWSLEHIHAQQDKGLTNNEVIKSWLEITKRQIELVGNLNEAAKETHKVKLLEDIKEFLNNETYKSNKEGFMLLQSNVFMFFGQTDVHTIDNLALLPKHTNSALSNNIFPVKREMILRKDKTGEFIPICTKNVFLKYYSKEVDNLHFWTFKDGQNYLEEIKTVLGNF